MAQSLNEQKLAFENSFLLKNGGGTGNLTAGNGTLSNGGTLSLGGTQSGTLTATVPAMAGSTAGLVAPAFPAIASPASAATLVPPYTPGAEGLSVKAVPPPAIAALPFPAPAAPSGRAPKAPAGPLGAPRGGGESLHDLVRKGDGRQEADREKDEAAKAAKAVTPSLGTADLRGPSVPARQPDAPAPGAPAASAPAGPPVPTVVHLGAMRSHWLRGADGTERLALVRTARLDSRVVYQGVLLDWERLRGELLGKVNDLFPDASLVPFRDPVGITPERAMTALPVQLDPGGGPALPAAGWTPLRIGLALAWAAATIALVAVGLGGWSLIDLSERRIRFVSAVTHELRTPLTSLRLYLDMLTNGMVTDEARRAEYLATLAAEADRLHRLVDNVLDFARIENRPRRADRKAATVGELLDSVRETWRDRCAADGRELVAVSTLPPDRVLVTDPDMLRQVVGNLIDNARKYAREAEDRRIWLFVRPAAGGRVAVEVEDRGPGIPVRERAGVFRPFRRGAGADTVAGGAGLGLALARQWAAALGGRLTYRPADGGVGACFRLELPGS